MPTILGTIIEYEEDILEMIMEAWGINLEHKEKRKNTEQVSIIISQKKLIEEMFDALPEKYLQAINALFIEKGRIPWDKFTREFGELREMGSAHRRQVRPDRNPVSTTEALFYRGIIGRAFFETGQGLKEFAFIPEEFYQYLQPVISISKSNTFEPISDNLVEKTVLANDTIIDHACTILAGLRIALPVEDLPQFTQGLPVSFLIQLLQGMKLITTTRLEISSKNAKGYLESQRGTALTQMVQAWKNSQEIDELDLIESLEFESKRKNNPLQTRNFLLGLISGLAMDRWFDIQGFCNWVHDTQPDFIRSGGEYDAWFVKDPLTGESIKGFDNWQRVEGNYIKTMILDVLFWTGFLDLGKRRGEKSPTVFRKSKWFKALESGVDLKYSTLQKKEFELEKSGRITIDRFFPRDIRYQVARCSEWESVRGHKYSYRLSPNAFQRMESQGLKISQLILLIRHYSRKPLPQNILDALERWEKFGKETELEKIIILKVKSAVILDRLISSPAKKYIISRLNDTSAEIAGSSVPYIKAALTDMGFFPVTTPDL
jgi:hypothetical protein